MFFFKQKTAYEMRISDWSSDVYSSDLRERDAFRPPRRAAGELDIDGVARVGGDIVQDRQMARRYIVKPQPSLGSRFVQHDTPFQPGRLDLCQFLGIKIGQASCRERVCQYV